MNEMRTLLPSTLPGHSTALLLHIVPVSAKLLPGTGSGDQLELSVPGARLDVAMVLGRTFVDLRDRRHDSRQRDMS